MSGDCCHHDAHASAPAPGNARLTRVLWAALAINLIMFVVEIFSGMHAGSQSLLADAIDFFSDAANYAITLAVLPLGLVWRVRAARFKGATMLLLGLFVAARSVWALSLGEAPQAIVMGVIGLLALAANLAVALMLYAHRGQDLNMRSVWLCSRNDAIGNLAVVLAALGVFGTGSVWPDSLVAGLISGMAIWGGLSILRQAGREARTAGPGIQEALHSRPADASRG